MKKAGKAIHGAKAAVQSAGFQWENAQMHEHEVNLLQRFLVDSSLSSGTGLHSRYVTLGYVPSELQGVLPAYGRCKESPFCVNITPLTFRGYQTYLRRLS